MILFKKCAKTHTYFRSENNKYRIIKLYTRLNLDSQQEEQHRIGIGTHTRLITRTTQEPGQ